MTNVRRLVAVAAGLAVVAFLSSRSWGEPQSGKVRNSTLPGDGSRPAAGQAADPEAALAQSKFEQGGVLSYKPLEGDNYFALQLQPKLDPAPRRPRDYLLLVSTSAGQSGAAWNAARQLTEAVIKDAGPQDRIALWTISTPQKEFTRCLTGDFVLAKDAKIEQALKKLADQYPAGDTDLKNGLSQAVQSFGPANDNQRVLLYLGDGLSTHTPLAAADRTDLVKDMVEKRINFFAIPLGMAFSPENLHGFACGTGGVVVRVQLLQETLPDTMKRVEAAFAAPVLYPTKVEMPANVSEFYPAKLPPLRSDAPTLLVGRMKAAKEFSLTVKGTIEGVPGQVSKVVTEPVHEPEVDNFFLVKMATQWAKARDQHALIRADRALVFAYQDNRLKRLEALSEAQAALQDSKLDIAASLFQKARELAPQDADAAAGLDVVNKVRSGKITLESLRKQLNRPDRQVARLEMKGGVVRTIQGQIEALQKDLEKNLPPVAPVGGGVGQQPPADDLLKAHRDRMIVEEQNLRQSVELSLRQARRELSLDPDAAYETLKSTLARVQEHPDLSNRVREDLVRRLQNQLRDIQQEGAQVKLWRAQQREITQRILESTEKDMQRKAEEGRIEARFRVYKNLLNQARFERYTEEKILEGLDQMQKEAYLQGRDAPLVTQAAYLQASASFNLEVQRELRRKRELGFLAVLLEVEKSHVPYPDEPPIHFPPLAVWQKLSEYRKAKYEVTHLPDDEKGRKAAQRIQKMLEEVIDMKDFNKDAMTLKEALGLFQDKLNAKYKEDDVLPILVDEAAFKAENPDAPSIYDTEVKFPPFPRRMSVATALRIALSKVATNNATYLIRRNFIEVTTLERQAKERVLAVYPVGDLVIPISQPINPFAQGGLGGAIGGGFGMGGMGGFPGMGMGMGMPGMGMPGMMPGMGMGMPGMGFPGMGMPGMGMPGMGFPGMGMPGMGMPGMGFPGMGMPGMGMPGMGMPGMGMPGMGMPGMGGMGIPGQNCLGFNQFNGGLGAVGSTMNQGLILLIQQLVAPGEWGQQQCMTQVPFPGMPGMPGQPGLPGAPPLPPAQGGPAPDIQNSNTIGFYAPALALVVRGTSRVHTKETGGVMGGGAKPKEIGFENPQIAKNNKPPKVEVAGGAGEDNDPARKKLLAEAADLDARKVWQEALANGVDNPGVIIAAADFLFERGFYNHAAEFLKANLRQGILVRPWVYEALAIALEASGGSSEEIRRVRLSGLALDPQDATGFMKAARAMAAHKEWDRAVAFCKKAAELEPNSPHPYAEALAFAEKAKDASGLEWAASHLLRQDWPTDTSTLHLRAQLKLDTFAGQLDADRRKPEAARLRAALREVSRRDLVIQLTWEAGLSGSADLDLEVKEPGGSVCSSMHRQSPGGGTWTGTLVPEKKDQALRVAYTASQGFAGEYEVTIRRVWGEPLGGQARVEIIMNQGTPQEVRRLETIRVSNKTSFKVNLKEGRRTEVAVVSPSSLERPSLKDEEVKERRILDRLRDIADPFYTAPPTGIRGSAGSGRGSTDAIAPLSRQAALGGTSGRDKERKQAEHVAFQTAIAPGGGSGVSLSATATVSPDQQYLRLSVTPMFRTSGATMPRPAASNVPLIPGGVTP